METYIALLLMIVPGFISKIIFEKLNCEKKYVSDMVDIITSLIFSIFILLMNYTFYYIVGITKNSEVSFLLGLFSSNKFIISYILITFINSIYIALAWDSLSYYFLKNINRVRTSMGKNRATTSRTIFESLSDGKPHLLKVTMANKTIYGEVNSIYKDNGNDSGFSLCNCVSSEDIIIKSDDRIQKLGEEKANISKVEYFFPNSDLQITEYITEKRKMENMKNMCNPSIKIFFVETGIFLLSIFVISILIKYVFKLI